MDWVAEQAEVVIDHRGYQLTGKDQGKHGGGAELGGDNNCSRNKERTEQSSTPDPPWLGCGRGQRRSRDTSEQIVDDQTDSADGK